MSCFPILSAENKTFLCHNVMHIKNKNDRGTLRHGTFPDLRFPENYAAVQYRTFFLYTAAAVSDRAAQAARMPASISVSPLGKQPLL